MSPLNDAVTGTVVVNPRPGVYRCPSAEYVNTDSYIELRNAPQIAVSGKPQYINGIAVYPYPGGGGASYVAPSVGLEISVSGPYGQRVLLTLSLSPRDKVLTPGASPPVPSSWRTVKFAGLRFSVPPTWPVVHTARIPYLGTACEAGVAFPSAAVTLSTDESPMSPPVCPESGVSVQVPSNAVQVNSGPGSQAQLMAHFAAKCTRLNGMSICPAEAPEYSILVLKVSTDTSTQPLFVALGLGDAGTARTVLHSLHPNP